MNNIHATAIVHPSCKIGDNVSIGPYSIIGENVTIGDNTSISHHVVIEKDTTIGKNNEIFSGAILGGDPQDIGYHGEKSYLEIGDNNRIREYVTIHRGSREGLITKVGDNNYIMAYVHIGHDCHLYNNIICTSFAGISGHCILEDYCIIGGLAGLHQFVRVGKMAMVGGTTRGNIDVPPFTLCAGNPMVVKTTNTVGLRRRGIDNKTISALSDSIRTIFHAKLNRKTALSLVSEKYKGIKEVEYLVNFLNAVRDGNSGRQEQI